MLQSSPRLKTSTGKKFALVCWVDEESVGVQLHLVMIKSMLVAHKACLHACLSLCKEYCGCVSASTNQACISMVRARARASQPNLLGSLVDLSIS